MKKSNKGIIILLSVIIVILLVACILLATGKINLKSSKTNNAIVNSNQAVQNDDNANNESNQITDNSSDNYNCNTINNEYSNMIGEYVGVDPWDEHLTVKVHSISGNTVIWTIINTYYEQKVSSELKNGTVSFNIKGISEKKGKNEFNYIGTLILGNNIVIVRFEDGQLTSVSSDGGGGFMMANALSENAKTVTLKKNN